MSGKTEAEDKDIGKQFDFLMPCGYSARKIEDLHGYYCDDFCKIKGLCEKYHHRHAGHKNVPLFQNFVHEFVASEITRIHQQIEKEIE